MGQLFTWQDVVRHRVPKLESFTTSLGEIRDAFAHEACITGALACGSVIRGDQTIRSDVDCVVIYRPEEQTRAFQIMQELTLVAHTRHVPLAFIACDTLVKHTRFHHYGPSFQRHLSASAKAGGLLKGNPLEDVAESVAERAELESYLRVKLYNLQEGFAGFLALSEERKAALLKKFFEAPMHVARKVLAYYAPLEMDSKAYIRDLYKATMSVKTVELFEYLIELDRAYTELLEEQLLSQDCATYERFLAGLFREAGSVIAFVRANVLCLAQQPAP